MITADGLTKKFGTTVALEDVSFSAAEGDVVAIVGPNGAGKTTLFRLLATVIAPDSGRAAVGGFDTVLDSLRVRAITGAVYTDPALYERLTPREILRYFGKLYGLPAAVLEDRIAQVLVELDLTAFESRLSGTLSRGMKQRAVLARAVLHQPQVLLLDEPTTGLDFRSAERVLQFLDGYRQGRCILFATHNFQEISLCCNRLLVLDQGRIVLDRELGPERMVRPGPDEIRSIVLETTGGGHE